MAEFFHAPRVCRMGCLNASFANLRGRSRALYTGAYGQEMQLSMIQLPDPAVNIDDLKERARRASDFLKALAHESRLLILCLVAERERSVTELEQILSLRQPAVSQQLARLRMDGLVTTRRDGKTVYYSLANEDVRRIMGVMYEVFCRSDAEILDLPAK
jgi:DNA-binding transcriptional ArsR family regulator